MNYIFEIEDKTGRKIYLTKERWTHILEHSDITIHNLEEIKLALTNPSAIIPQAFDEDKSNYYLYDKKRKSYLLVAVKYLNGRGFITTAFFTKHLSKKWTKK